MELNGIFNGSYTSVATSCNTDFSYRCLRSDIPSLTCEEEIRELNVSHNLLEKVPKFPQMRSLCKLDLSYNRLLFVRKNDFVNLTALQKIDLSNNNILKIQPETFDQLGSLEEINLGFNYLGVLDVSNLFKNLPHLTLVILDGNLDLCLQGYKEKMSFIKWTPSCNKNEACATQSSAPTTNSYIKETHEIIMTKITTEGSSSNPYTTLEGDSSATVSTSVPSENNGPTFAPMEDKKPSIRLKDSFFQFSPITLAIITGLTFNIITLILYLHMNWSVKMSITRKTCH